MVSCKMYSVPIIVYRNCAWLFFSGIVIFLLLFFISCDAFAEEERNITVSFNDETFNKWLDDLRAEAIAEGISEDTVNKAIPKDISIIEKVVKIDRKQPEFVRDLKTYLDEAVYQKRITNGIKMMKKHEKLLAEISEKYGVRPYSLVALWGVESNYGTHTGGYPVVNALVTLAYDARRSDFFRKELKNALQILDSGYVDFDSFEGSWAGAMGQFQFMPSTFLKYAVDYDGDGKKDIWNNYADSFASAANYLSSIGWKSKEKWGREVVLPKDFKAFDDTGLEKSFDLQYWKKLGLKTPLGNPIPVAPMVEASLILPEGYKQSAFLVYHNFNMILDWNKSINYALAIGLLSNRLAGREEFKTVKPFKESDRLSRYQISIIQQHLFDKGIYNSKIDGFIGAYTRQGVRVLQRHYGLPADGYPDQELYNLVAAETKTDGSE